MAGIPKKGIDYVGWSTSIFEDDTKIDALLDDQGWNGFAVYFYLCQKAYASDGYFYRWSYADAPSTARKMSGGIRSGTVKSAVGTCCRVGLFDKRLLEGHGILTSRGIQRRFVKAIEKRSYRAVNKLYWLLDEAETKAGKIKFLENDLPGLSDSYAENKNVLPEDGDVLPENDPKSKVKYKSSWCSYAPAHEEEKTSNKQADFGRVYSVYEDRVGRKPSTNLVREMMTFVEELSADVVLHALDIAWDNGKIQNWEYITGILERWKASGLTTLEKVRADERRFENEKRERWGRQNASKFRRGGSGTGASAAGAGGGQGGVSQWDGLLHNDLDD